MCKCETKAIQTDLGTFRHSHAYSKPCVTLAYIEPWYIQNPDIFRTRRNSKPWHIYNPGIFTTPVYSERWHVQNPRHIQNPVKHLR